MNVFFICTFLSCVGEKKSPDLVKCTPDKPRLVRTLAGSMSCENSANRYANVTVLLRSPTHHGGGQT